MRTSHVAAVACAVAAACSITLFADDKAKAPSTQPAMMNGMDQAAMEAAWVKHATPGPQHAELQKDVGEWKCEMQEFMMPGSPPQTGTAKVTSILGGRFTMEEFKGSMMGQPFEGIALTGYDNTLGRYDTTWIDSMGTSIMVMHGNMTATRWR